MDSHIQIGNHQVALEISFFNYGRQLGHSVSELRMIIEVEWVEITLMMVGGSSGLGIDTEIDSCDMTGSVDIYTQMSTAITILVGPKLESSWAWRHMPD